MLFTALTLGAGFKGGEIVRYTTEQYFTEVHGGKIELTLPPLSGIVLRHGE